MGYTIPFLNDWVNPLQAYNVVVKKAALGARYVSVITYDCSMLTNSLVKTEEYSFGEAYN